MTAPQADELDKTKNELLRPRFDEQVRSEKRKAGGSLIEAGVNGALKPSSFAPLLASRCDRLTHLALVPYTTFRRMCIVP
jgi:hypothetical protein